MNRDLIESYKQQITEARLPTFFRNLGRGAGRGKRVVGKVADWVADNPYKALGIGTGIAGVGAGAAYYFGSDGSQMMSPTQQENEQKRSRKAQTKEMQTRLKQEMANIRSAGETDEVAIRKQAIENLGKDKDFVAQANQMGYSVGKVSGSESGMFGYRYGSGEEAKKASEASRAQLFDAQGRAKVFEKDPTTGKLVGRDPTNTEVAARAKPITQQPTQPSGRQPFRYINPNSPEGRIEAQIKSGEMPDIWARDSSGRIIQGQGLRGGKLPMDLQKEREAAGEAAYNASLNKSLADMDAETETMINNLQIDGSPISDQEKEGLRNWTKERTQKVRQQLFR